MLCACVGVPLGLNSPGSAGASQQSKVRGIVANTSRGNGSLGQAQFGEASGEAEELLAQTEETWGVGREMGPVRGWAVDAGGAVRAVSSGGQAWSQGHWCWGRGWYQVGEP